LPTKNQDPVLIGCYFNLSFSDEFELSFKDLMNENCNQQRIIDQCSQACNKKKNLYFAVNVEELRHTFQCLCSNNFSEDSVNQRECNSKTDIICTRSLNSPLIIYKLDKGMK
jgi:hypothetical protein